MVEISKSTLKESTDYVEFMIKNKAFIIFISQLCEIHFYISSFTFEYFISVIYNKHISLCTCIHIPSRGLVVNMYQHIKR